MFHDPVLEVFDGGWRLQAVGLQSGQHGKSLHWGSPEF
jgi:hypothetical protein